MESTKGIDLSDVGLAGIVRSDMLRPLRELATFIPWLRLMGLPAQFRVVIDANVVFAELIWLTGRRRNRDARTNLQELVAAGTLLLFAPTWLDQEVREHAEEFAAEAGVSVDQYLLAWEAYCESIIFVQPKSNGKHSEIDPDDAPYVSACEEFGAHAVYSNDHHISRMGAPTINSEVIVTLKNYSRAASWQYTIQYSGMVVTILSWHTLVGSLLMLVGVARFVRSSPTWVQALLLAAAIALIAHPSSRLWMAKTARRVGGSLQTVMAETGQVAIQLGAEATLKAQQAHEALSKVEGYFESRRIPLRLLVLAVCLKEQRPLSLEEIERRVLANGYQTRAIDFRSYLRRVLRESKDLVQGHGGWTYSSI